MKAEGLILLLSCFLGLSLGFYESNGAVTSLTSANFDSLVYGSEHPWIVEFYAPWCGHCQRLVPEYEKAAENLKGLARIGAVNCDEDSGKAVCGRFQIQGFPTLKIFPGSTTEPTKKGQFKKQEKDYQGARSARAIADAVLAEIPNFSSKIISGPTAGKNKNIEEFISEEGIAKALLFTTKSTTTHLFKALSVDFRNRIRLGEIRETEKEVVQKYQVEKFPALLIFPKEGGEPITYDGTLQHAKLHSFLEQYALPKKGSSKSQSGQEETQPPKEEPAEVFDPEIKKIENQAQFEEECLKRPVGMCLLAFMALEPEFEESVAEHQAQLQILKSIKKTVHDKKMGFRVFWIDGLKEKKLMDSFALSDQLPSLMILSPSKKIYRPFTAGFEEKSVIEFLEETTKARGRHFKFDQTPTMSS